jgi:PLP dependent protein
MTTSVAENLEQVRSTILDHAARAGRDPAGVTLVAVTKTVPLARIREAMAAGLSVLGENRVQEALPKIEQLGTAGLDWHLIGHLQRNKVRFIDGAFTMVQSVDSIGLVEALDRRIQAPLQVLLEVNVAEEAQKTGALPSDAEAIVRATAASSRLRLRGLMTIAPQSANPEDARPVFRRLARLRTELAARLEIALPVLSMGMTDDYGVAVEEGATMLRLGRALFGPR